VSVLCSLNRQNLPFKTHEIIGHIIYYLRNAALKIESIDVAETIKTTKALIETEASSRRIKKWKKRRKNLSSFYFVFFRYTVLLAHEILESLLPIGE
jgi:hypothetical protein